MNLSQTKARAQKLGITAADVSSRYGGTKKECWQQAVADAEQAQMDAALAAEAAEENRKAAANRAYQSSSAVVTIPAALALGLGRALFPKK